MAQAEPALAHPLRAVFSTLRPDLPSHSAQVFRIPNLGISSTVPELLRTTSTAELHVTASVFLLSAVYYAAPTERTNILMYVRNNQVYKHMNPVTLTTK